jgi:hypothetical protein
MPYFVGHVLMTMSPAVIWGGLGKSELTDFTQSAARRVDSSAPDLLSKELIEANVPFPASSTV